MRKNIYTLFFLSLFLNSISTTAQYNKSNPAGCETDQAMKAYYEAYPEEKKKVDEQKMLTRMYIQRLQEDRKNGKLEKFKKPNTARYIIPVVFHVIHQNGEDRISVEQCQSALDIANRDLNGLNDDWNDQDPLFDPIKATLDIELCLAKKDPNGNPTDGVAYHEDSRCLQNTSNDPVPMEYAWDNWKYMEVYVSPDMDCSGPSEFNSGYAYFPSDNMSNQGQARIVYNYRNLGDVGAAVNGVNNKEYQSVFTHEVGHWLELYHTFEGGCSNLDEVDDTPATTQGAGCGNNVYACGNFVNGHNYMDYNTCNYSMFTQGQVDRMTNALENHESRRRLWQPDNLQATGCSPVTATSPPAASFSWMPDNPSYNSPISFIDESLTIDPITSWSWTFEGANIATSTDQNPTGIEWPTGGVFEVTLTVTNSYGSNKATRLITIIGPLPPVPDFTVNGFVDFSLADIVTNTPVTIVSITETNSPITAWSWTMVGADITSSNTETVPAITYTTPGTYDITLTVTNDASTETITKQITVRSPFQPFAIFTGTPNPILEDVETIQFIDQSASETPILSWEWEFPGSSMPTFSGQFPPPLTYADPGAYPVKLTVTNAGGTGEQEIESFVIVTKNWITPIAYFQATTPTTIIEGETVSFENLSTAEAPISTTWLWEFEGGFPSTFSGKVPPAITYQTAGTYEVKLTVTNPGGTDTHPETAYITVGALLPPTAIWEINGGGALQPVTVVANTPVQFTDLSTPIGTITSWSWFAPGSDIIATSQTSDQNPVVMYSDLVAGNSFPVRLTVTNAAEPNSDEVTINAMVTVIASGSLLPPIANFTANSTTIDEGQSITFTDASIDNGTAITSYSWTFNGGDVTSATTAGPHTITFSAAGTYDIVLTVDNGNAPSSTKTIQVTVNQSGGCATAPIANITASATTILEGETITFTDNSNGNGDPITSWDWSFNTGAPSTANTEGPHAVTFNTVGTHNISLTVTNGCASHSTTIPITVNSSVCTTIPVADIIANTTNIIAGQAITFTDNTNDNGDPVTSWDWIFDTGTPGSATTEGPHTITYNTTGTHDVTLITTNSCGSDTKTIQINVGVSCPVADFTISNGGVVEEGGTLTFTDASTGDGISSWAWVINGGNPSSASTQDPGAVAFDTPGIHDVTLAVTNSCGTREITKQVTVTVTGALTAVIDMTPSTTLLPFNNKLITGESIDFADASISQLTITGWSWDFDGATTNSIQEDPGTVTFSTAGTYNISLTVDNGTTTDVANVTITVIDPLVPDFSASLTTIQVGETVDFTDLTTSPSAISSWSWTFTGADVVSSTDQNPTGITYSIPGTYPVTLIVSNADQTETAVKIDYITVGNVLLPTADFFGNITTIKIGETVTFTDASVDNGNAITSWDWTFEGGTPATANTVGSHTVTYNTPGTYKVRLTVTNSDGPDTEEKWGYITVMDLELPVVDFEVADNKTIIGVGMCVDFTDLSTSTLPITTWDWAFEGGAPATSNQINPKDITYSAAGTYKVSLTVTNTDGSIIKEEIGYITVQGDDPNPYCTAQRTDDCRCEFEFIENVKISGFSAALDHSSGCGNYSYYPNESTGTLATALDYTITVKAGNATQATPVVTAYFDWDDNKTFDGGAEEVSLIYDGATGTASRTFTVPESAKHQTGTRMRVRLQFFRPGSACGDSEYGEIQDYLVNIEKGPVGIVDPQEEKNLSAYVYPNPNNGRFNIRLDSPTNIDGQLVLHDVNGRVVYQEIIGISEGETNRELNNQELVEGFYYLKIYTSKGLLTQKITIIK